jgi:acetoin:2,6-dichlorophenolindophenol oxidoreductase subunit alpha
MSRHKSINLDDLSERAKAYGIPGRSIDGQNVFEVYDAVVEALAHVRAHGPMLLVSETYRYMGHSKSDANRYRTKDEINEWKQRDPIVILRTEILKRKALDEAQLAAIEKETREDIEAAVRFAESADEPDLADIINDVYA